MVSKLRMLVRKEKKHRSWKNRSNTGRKDLVPCPAPTTPQVSTACIMAHISRRRFSMSIQRPFALSLMSFLSRRSRSFSAENISSLSWSSHRS